MKSLLIEEVSFLNLKHYKLTGTKGHLYEFSLHGIEFTKAKASCKKKKLKVVPVKTSKKPTKTQPFIKSADTLNVVAITKIQPR